MKERESDVRAVSITCLEINEGVSLNPIYLIVGVRNIYLGVAPYTLYSCPVFSLMSG